MNTTTQPYPQLIPTMRTQPNPQPMNAQESNQTMQTIQCYETLSPITGEGIIRAATDKSDAIEIVNSEACDLDAMAEAMKAQAKHGVLGSALRYLYLDETESGTALFMAERRDALGWLEEYKAVYWFVAGWLDAEFYAGKEGSK